MASLDSLRVASKQEQSPCDIAPSEKLKMGQSFFVSLALFQVKKGASFERLAARPIAFKVETDRGELEGEFPTTN